LSNFEDFALQKNSELHSCQKKTNVGYITADKTPQASVKRYSMVVT
jgi:hypothetical protein